MNLQWFSAAWGRDFNIPVNFFGHPWPLLCRGVGFPVGQVGLRKSALNERIIPMLLQSPGEFWSNVGKTAGILGKTLVPSTGNSMNLQWFSAGWGRDFNIPVNFFGHPWPLLCRGVGFPVGQVGLRKSGS